MKVVVAALLVAGMAPSVLAQDAWEFRLTPYAWLAGLKGSVGTIPGQPPVSVDVSPSDALKHLEGGGMIMLDARNRRHGLLVDLVYTNVQSDIEVLPPPIGLQLETISKTTIASLASQYEFYAGRDNQGQPVWTSDFAKIQPLIDWYNNCGCVTATYNAPLKKYLMCITDGWPTCAKMNSYILEADVLTGPWRMAAYLEHFGEQAYFLNFPSKFIRDDGRTLWLSYSANFSPGWSSVDLKVNPPGGRYGLCLHELKLLRPGEDK